MHLELLSTFPARFYFNTHRLSRRLIINVELYVDIASTHSLRNVTRFSLRKLTTQAKNRSAEWISLPIPDFPGKSHLLTEPFNTTFGEYINFASANDIYPLKTMNTGDNIDQTQANAPNVDLGPMVPIVDTQVSQDVI